MADRDAPKRVAHYLLGKVLGEGGFGWYNRSIALVTFFDAFVLNAVCVKPVM